MLFKCINIEICLFLTMKNCFLNSEIYSNSENIYIVTVNLRLLTVNTDTFRKKNSLLGNIYFHCYWVRRLRTYIFTVREGLPNSEISLLDNKISLLVYNSPGRMTRMQLPLSLTSPSTDPRTSSVGTRSSR